MIVVDASMVFAALTGVGEDATWAESVLASSDLGAPHHMPGEVANVLRRHELARLLSPEVTAFAHAELLALPVALYPYAPCAERAWALRSNVTTPDAWYVALAELLDAPLATLDRPLSRASGPRCGFVLPPAG